MILNIKILVGIPGSGKTTWSKKYVLDNPNTKRINRDDLRVMLDVGKITNGNENFLRVLRLELVNMCIIYDKNIVVDDTNCQKEQLGELIDFIITNRILLEKEIEIEIIDFDVDFDECVFRDNHRENHLGLDILRHMQAAKNEIDFNSLLIEKYQKITN